MSWSGFFAKRASAPAKHKKHEGHPVKTLPNALYFSRRYKTKVQDVFLFIAYFIKRRKNPVTGFCVPTLVERRTRLPITNNSLTVTVTIGGWMKYSVLQQIQEENDFEEISAINRE
jgi:hypothetical protein